MKQPRAASTAKSLRSYGKVFGTMSKLVDAITIAGVSHHRGEQRCYRQEIPSTLTQALRPEMIWNRIVTPSTSSVHSDDKLRCALHDMTRALLHMVVGVGERLQEEAGDQRCQLSCR